MITRFAGISLAALSLTAFGFVALPSYALAQDGGADSAKTASNDQLDRPINLDVRSANLYYALTLLFDQLKVGNYTLPEPLKQREVSAHFTRLPLRTALETLLKNSGYTYRVEGGVYSVVAKLEAPIDPPLDRMTPPEPDAKGKKIYRITSGQMIYNAVDIVTRLGGKVLPGAVGSQSGASSTGGRTGGFGSGGPGGGLTGGIGGFGSGMGGGALVGGLGGTSGGPGGGGTTFGAGGPGAGGGGRRPGGF